MKATIWNKLDLTARRLTPFLSTVVLVIVGLMPMHIPGYSAVSPSLTLIAVYYWALHRPDLMPAVAVFAVGLLQDVLAGALFGANTFILLVVYGVVLSQRRVFHGKSFLVVWWGFSVVAGVVALVRWLAFSTIAAAEVAPQPAI